MAQWVKHLPAVQETQKTQVQSLGQEDPLEKEMAEELVGYGPRGRKEPDRLSMMMMCLGNQGVLS